MNKNITGNHYNKYESKNPLVRILMNGFLNAFDKLLKCTDAKTVYECGCGEGYLSLHLFKSGYNVSGCDIGPEVVAQTLSRIQSAGYNGDFIVRDIAELRDKTSIADLIVCCEVLEHTSNPEETLKTIVSLSKKWVILSVPNEPWWRMMNMARLKYLSQLGNTPGHTQHWSARKFVTLVSLYFDVIDVQLTFPWTVVLCKKKEQTSP
jgi:2-polyprenyl-3-methyl-5-hydroxy-6-metoxy-1,4-benzoquinol methylase